MKRKRLDKWEKWNEREKIEKDGRREKMGKVGEMEGGRGSEERPYVSCLLGRCTLHSNHE